MAERSFIYTSKLVSDGAGGQKMDRTVNADDLRMMIKSIISNGVYANPVTNLKVKKKTGNNMGIEVQPGEGWIDGGYYINDESKMFTLSMASGVNARIDTIVLRYSKLNREIRTEYIEGIPAVAPVAKRPERTTDIIELILCEILVARGVTSIREENITDKRYDDNVCGIVAGTIKQITTNDLFSQFTNAFDMWFKDCKNTLGEDSAGKLLIKIDNNKKDIETKAEAIDKKIDTHILDYKNLESKKDKLFSVKMAGDFVYGYNEGQSVLRPIPFSDTRPGYYRKTDYAELQSNGEIKITKKGNYKVEMKVFISDSPGMNGTYHFLIQKNREHLSENYTPTSTINPNNICAGSTGMTEILNVGDIINGYIAPPRYSSLYRIDGAITWLNIIPLSFL
ncbi:MAG: hypothetical protein RSB90_09740 [Eubacterium sp.]